MKNTIVIGDITASTGWIDIEHSVEVIDIVKETINYSPPYNTIYAFGGLSNTYQYITWKYE